MPGLAQTDTIIHLPANYQQQGYGSDESEVVSSATSDGDERFSYEQLEELPEATIESWLMDPQVPEEWVPLKTRRMKVRIRGLTEEERKGITKAAPRKMNKETKRVEPDQDWINIELVRRCLVKPAVPKQDMLLKSLAGDLAHLASEIGRISGFDLSDALG